VIMKMRSLTLVPVRLLRVVVISAKLLLVMLFTLSARDLSGQPVPHHFSGITALPDRTISLKLDGSVSNMFSLTGTVSNQFRQTFDQYVVEATTNLVNWIRLAVLLRTNSDPNPLGFQDTNATLFSQRYYRTFTNHLITALRKPTGPFAVGTLSRVVTDASRSNRYSLPTNSSFMTTFWYPAEPPGAGRLPCLYTDRAVAGDRSFYTYWGYSYQWTSAVPWFVAHSTADLALAEGTSRFPVILHSHGWTCDRRFNSQVAEELASHGYIVVAVDHEDCHATVYPDARGTRYVAPGSRIDYALLLSRIRDLQCLLDELVSLDASDPLLAGRLDLEHVGVMGHSLGGGVAAETARLESRIRCAALLDAAIDFSFYSVLNSQGLRKPFLAMNSTIPLPGIGDLSSGSQRLFTLATNDATWLKINNTGHFAFSDWAWSVDMTAASRPGAVAVNACLVWFFDTFLKGQTPAFPTNSQLINVQRK